MDKILELKKIILELAYKIKEGHIASSFSIIDILYLLYNKIMSNDDMFILSKGHASLALYAILYDKGIISKEDLFSFCEFNSNLGGHPKLNTVMGINASTGSLGHGFPMAIGMALGRKINNKSGTIYCLIGDGEANEGTVYESMLIANQHNLDNICLIVDNNLSIDSTLSLGSFGQKAQSFGWDTSEVVGHNFYDLQEAFEKKTSKPKCIVAYTIKGYGCDTLVKEPQKWHHAYPTEEEYIKMMEELQNEKTIYKNCD